VLPKNQKEIEGTVCVFLDLANEFTTGFSRKDGECFMGREIFCAISTTCAFPLNPPPILGVHAIIFTTVPMMKWRFGVLDEVPGSRARF
jgi:hypothetical protein